MSEAWRTVDVWFGRFPSEALLEALFAETYSREGELQMHFAGLMGAVFLDRDFMERSFAEAPWTDPWLALAEHSFSASYAASVAAAWEAAGARPFQCVVLCWAGAGSMRPRSARIARGELDYLGRHACDPEAGGALG